MPEGPCGLIGGGVEDLPEARDSAIRRLHREQTAAVAGIVDRATSVCAESTQGLVRLDNDGAASRGTTREMLFVDGVLDHLALVAVETE